jgi:hypothetical protein
MNVEKALYRSLRRLGINFIRPQDYMVSRADYNHDLVFACLEQVGSSLYIMVATYLMEDHIMSPDSEVVIEVTPEEMRATVLTCEWVNTKEIASSGLNRRVRAWLEQQVTRGHNFVLTRKRRSVLGRELVLVK